MNLGGFLLELEAFLKLALAPWVALGAISVKN
jgi:hypothetical protein